MGVAEGNLRGAETLAIHAQTNPHVACSGEFTSSAVLGGSGQLRCSDGATATFNFQRLSVFHGHGVGSHTRGAMRFTYGIAADQSHPYLKLPAGKALRQRGEFLQLVDL